MKRLLLTGVAVVSCAMASESFAAPDTPAPTPMPPDSMCGQALPSAYTLTERHQKFQTQMLGTGQLEMTDEDAEIISYTHRATEVQWAFSKPAYSLHPVIVCMKPDVQGDMLAIHVETRCEVNEAECDALQKRYEAINASLSRTVLMPASEGEERRVPDIGAPVPTPSGPEVTPAFADPTPVPTPEDTTIAPPPDDMFFGALPTPTPQ